MAKKPPKPKPLARRRGRKPDISEAQIKNLERLLRQKKTSVKSACILSGINPDTYYTWMAKATLAKAPPVYTEFADRMIRARELGKIAMIESIQKAGHGSKTKPGDWRATAWLLERMHPDEFGTRERLNIVHSGKTAVQHQHTHETKQIVVVLPEAIATPRPLPKQINARENPPAPPETPPQ